MESLTSPGSKPSLKQRGLRLGLLSGLVAATLSVAVKYRNRIVYGLRLLNVQRLATKFYRSYPGIHKNIAYGAAATQKLDIYRPLAGEKYPVVLYVYGGGWYSGSKEMYAPAAQMLLQHELVIVLISYTLNPQATYRQQTREVAQALDWVLRHIQDYGGDPQRVFIGGQSAGAHLSALALCDPQWLQPLGRSPADVRGFYGISGAYDINRLLAFQQARGNEAPLLTRVFESRDNFANASPINYVRAGLPPFLLIHGDADTVVPLNISEAFHEKLQAVGVHSDLKIYSGAKHAGLLFDALTANPSRLSTDLSNFFSRHG